MKEHVLLDLDGTLTDPGEGFVASIRYALETLGRTVPSDELLRGCIGPPLELGMAAILGSDDPALRAEAVRLYRDRYGRIGLFENSIYPGIEPVLSQLASSGTALFLATSKPKVFADRIIDHFGLRAHFRAIYGSELDGHLADKKQLITHLLKSESLDPETCCMVGDRSHDILGAIGNGITPLAVLWGYGSLEELYGAGARHFCELPDQLPQALTKIK